MANRVRYRVRATFRDEALKADFLNWMREKHGADLLAVDGCEEYRVYQAGPLAIDNEYLFLSAEHLQRYFEGPAEGLRAEGKARFPEGLEYERDDSELLLSSD